VDELPFAILSCFNCSLKNHINEITGTGDSVLLFSACDAFWSN